MRATSLILLAVLLLGCGATDVPSGDRDATDDPDLTPRSSPASPKPGDGPAVAQPPRDDEAVTRTGPLPLTLCTDGAPQFAFDGTVVAADGGVATFEVHEVFRGEVPSSFRVGLGEPVVPDRSEAAPSWSVGTRLLVQGSNGRAWGCGDTLYYDEETAADWRS